MPKLGLKIVLCHVNVLIWRKLQFANNNTQLKTTRKAQPQIEKIKAINTEQTIIPAQES